MIFREATHSDIEQCSVVRLAVKENQLSNPALISRSDYENFLTVFGKGWVCEIENKISGFAIVDLERKNIWALFVHPDYQAKGIGKKLHDFMIDWYFEQTEEMIWLGTSPKTRAEKFYRSRGWKENGKYGDEIKFELTKKDWINFKSAF